MPEPTIAVFTKNRLNPAYHAARLGADRTAARMGVATVHYVPERPDDIEQQIALIEQAVETRPAALVFVPVHGTAIDAAISAVNAAGIPVFNLINQLRHSESYVTFVGADDHQLAVQISDFLFRRLGGHGDVVVLEGTPGSVTSRDRVQGFLDTARAYPEVRIVASRAGNFLQEDGKRAMQQMLDEAPQIDGALAANDSMALGAIEALEAAGRTSLVVGVNAIPAAIAALKSGKLLATADFDAFKIACVAMEAAVRYLRGLPVPKQILLPVQIVEAGNCAAWDRSIEKRECPDWHGLAGAAP